MKNLHQKIWLHGINELNPLQIFRLTEVGFGMVEKLVNQEITKNSITGYTIIEASNLDETEEIAKEYPFVDCTRVEIHKG